MTTDETTGHARPSARRPRASALLLLLAACACVALGARAARACSCGPTSAVLDSYEKADLVVVTRAVSVGKAERAAPKGRIGDDEHYVDGVKSTTMRVERVYKGGVQVGDELVFGQGGAADCVYTFSEESIGRRYLFYLVQFPRSRVWVAFTCGRSRPVEHAADDLLYLDNLDRVRGRTRLSGTVRFGHEGAPEVGGRLVRVVGEKKTYEARTNADGVYLYGEMYAHAGEYENCPRIERLIRKTGDDFAQLRTPAVELQADANLSNVVLRYPFPGCRKAQ